jgi:uncharacterized protein (UPF0332 family)
MPKSAMLKKKLDKDKKMEYDNKQRDTQVSVSEKRTEENSGKVGIKREEVIDALRSLEGVKRKLKKALESA